MTIMTVVAIGGMASFQFITKAIHRSRTRTLANNLIQEKMEVMKNYSYFGLMVTTHTTTNALHGIEYDDLAYPPETIAMWGYPVFTRAVHVAYAEMAGTQISTVSYAATDTGIKQITTYLMWEDGANTKLLTIKNLLANPAATGMDSGIRGTVTKALGGALEGAVVEVVGNANWTANTDSAGTYTFNVSKGTYSVICSSNGYYQQIKTNISAPRGGQGVADFSMVQVATGAFKTSVWISTGLVISQVCAGTGSYTAAGYRGPHVDGTEKDVEFIELYNPTTFTWTLDTGAFEILYAKQDWETPNEIPLTFTNNTIGPYQYFLIASTKPIVINGVSVEPDALYGDLQGHGWDFWVWNYTNVMFEYIPTIWESAQPGALGIKWNGSYLDRVAWKTGGLSPPAELTETVWPNDLPTYANGLKDGDVLVRQTEPGDVLIADGNAYDTDRNAANVMYMENFVDDHAQLMTARNTSTWKAPVSGKPAHGALAAAPDGYSLAGQAYPVNYGYNNERADLFIEG
ncbi:MAG: carboxypeptidase-like regulatory domain-containing protein, partial [Elusimicrobiota bacterium]